MFLTKKKLNKKIEQLEAEIRELKTTIVTNELKNLRQESKNFKDLRDNLANIHIGVKSAKFVDNGSDYPHIEVVYELPIARVYLKDDGGFVRNEMFRSLNLSGMISKEGTEKIQKAINASRNNK